MSQSSRQNSICVLSLNKKKKNTQYEFGLGNELRFWVTGIQEALYSVKGGRFRQSSSKRCVLHSSGAS